MPVVCLRSLPNSPRSSSGPGPGPRSAEPIRAIARTPRRWLLATYLLLGVGGGNFASGCSSVASSSLRIQIPEADKDAEVYVDGNYMGLVSALDSPETGLLELAPGTHRVEIRKPGRFPVQKTVVVQRKPASETVVEGELLVDPQW